MNGPHSENDEIAGRYKIESFIGEGGMQYVYNAQDMLLARNVALKTPKNPSAEKRFRRSAVVASKVNHPNVAKTLDYVEYEDRAYLVEELIVGADLDKAIVDKTSCVDPYLAARIMHNLSKGLAASHHAGVVHRDLKPTNIMVSGGFQTESIKITDFGIAKMAEEELAQAAENETLTGTQTAIGALPYMAPEAIATPREVTVAADVWSLGAMMYELLAGEKPFGSGLIAVSRIMSNQKPQFPAFITGNAQFSPLASSLIDIILECLSFDQNDRPTADEIVEKCSFLCYPTKERRIGTVIETGFRYGFISDQGERIFFHYDSIYGGRPAQGSSVMLSKYPGGGSWRAHPVVKLP
ncbi:MAG: serine/threonine-protein kinase [Halopseudomonas sp.]